MQLSSVTLLYKAKTVDYTSRLTSIITISSESFRSCTMLAGLWSETHFPFTFIIRSPICKVPSSEARDP